MSRKNRTPEENARRAKIRELLQEADITSMADIQSLFKETIAEFMENGLEAELDEELGYSKYDYRNKETDNSRNGHSSKKLKTSFGDVEVSTPRDRKGEFEPQLLRKNQTSISQDIEEKILSMYAKGMTMSPSRKNGQEKCEKSRMKQTGANESKVKRQKLHTAAFQNRRAISIQSKSEDELCCRKLQYKQRYRSVPPAWSSSGADEPAHISDS